MIYYIFILPSCTEFSISLQWLLEHRFVEVEASVLENITVGWAIVWLSDDAVSFSDAGGKLGMLWRFFKVENKLFKLLEIEVGVLELTTFVGLLILGADLTVVVVITQVDFSNDATSDTGVSGLRK